MISKETAEKKLLDLFYKMELDKIINKSPKKAFIEIFEQQESEEHNWLVNDNILKIFMSAKNYEEGVKYVAANFAMRSAIRDPGKKFSKFGLLYVILLFLYIFANIALTTFLKTVSYFLGIMVAIITFVIISGFFLAFRNWKEKVFIDFKIKINTMGFNYSAEQVQKYSKSLFNVRMLYFIAILIFIFISLVNLISAFSP